jgi:ribonuclease Y
MEQIALKIPGVTVAYAVQAGRELRVFVDSKTISDETLPTLARQIADRIQSEILFPGQIKVTVLRELRAIEVASR